MRTTQSLSIGRTALRYSLYTAAGLSAYEVLVSHVNLGLFGSPEILNLLILVIGIVASLRYYHKHNANVLYQDGMVLGCLTAFFSTVFYAGFLFVYYSFVDPAYLRHSLHYPKAADPNGLELAAITLIEGLSYGFIITFVTMQYYLPDEESI